VLCGKKGCRPPGEAQRVDHQDCVYWYWSGVRAGSLAATSIAAHTCSLGSARRVKLRCRSASTHPPVVCSCCSAAQGTCTRVMQVERCSRTVYVANIDKKVDRGDVRSFFEGLCGECHACVCSCICVSCRRLRRQPRCCGHRLHTMSPCRLH